MLRFLVRRSFIAIGTIAVISLIVFAVIEMPPGDAATSEVNTLRAQGGAQREEDALEIRALYGLDKPMLVRYGLWVKGMATGRLG